MFCSRCEDAFAKRDHVNSHLAACVGRNGNSSPPRYNLILIGQDLIRLQRLKQADYIYTWGVVQSTKLNLVNCPPTRSFCITLPVLAAPLPRSCLSERWGPLNLERIRLRHIDLPWWAFETVFSPHSIEELDLSTCRVAPNTWHDLGKYAQLIGSWASITREEDAQDLQDEDDHGKKPRAANDSSKSQSPRSADVSQIVDKHGDHGMIGEAESLEDNTSFTQLQSVSHTPQVRTKVIWERWSGADDNPLSISNKLGLTVMRRRLLPGERDGLITQPFRIREIMSKKVGRYWMLQKRQRRRNKSMRRLRLCNWECGQEGCSDGREEVCTRFRNGWIL